MATASANGTACVWDAVTGAKRYTMKHDGPLTWVAFHPDGKRIATSAEDGAVRMWSAADGEPIDWRLPIAGVIEHLAFSADSSRILAAGRDKAARVWSVDPPGANSPELPYRPPSDTLRYEFNQDRWPRFARQGQAVVSIDERGARLLAWGADGRRAAGRPRGPLRRGLLHSRIRPIASDDYDGRGHCRSKRMAR